MKTEIYREKAVLVGLITPNQNEERAREYLDELAFLADTAGATPEKLFSSELITRTLKPLSGPENCRKLKATSMKMTLD